MSVNPTTEKYIEKILTETPNVTISTVDENNRPYSRIVQLLMREGDKLYFLTEKGKRFYEQLIRNPYVSITGFKGFSINIQGKVRTCGREVIDKALEKNEYVANNVLPNEEMRQQAEIFELYEGEGEYIDLSILFRETFKSEEEDQRN